MITKIKKTIKQIRLWKDNKLDGEYTMTIEEFKNKFFTWLDTKDKSWCEYYGSWAAVNAFIGDKEGLSSVIDPAIYNELAELIRDKFWDVVSKKQDKKPTA